MVKIVAITLVFACLIVYLRSVNSEFVLLATVAAGIVIIFYALQYMSSFLTFFNDIIEKTGVNKELFIVIFKIISIAYLVEFGVDILVDFGLKSLADKLSLVGKLTIFTVSLPIIYAVLNLIKGLL